MSRRHSADESRQVYEAAMGPELGGLFCELYNECAWLHYSWAQYVELFGSSQQRIGLLMAAAPLTFRVMQVTLWDTTLLHLCRLTDPERSRRGEARLTVRRLPAMVVPAIAERTAVAVQVAVDRTAFARDWRNRRIAHQDLGLALEHPNVERLARASRAKVAEALEALRTVLNVVEIHYRRVEVRYDLVPEPQGAVDLLYVLHAGLEAQEAQRRRLQSGKPLPEDLRPPPLL